MNLIECMHTFVRVAERESFTRAADSLGTPKASVSTAVQQLEAHLGARLLHRTTRKVQLTQDGLAFYERCKDLLSDMDELQGMFRQDEENLSGRLRVDTPIGIAKHILLPALPQFMRQYPQLKIEFSSSDRRVDLVSEGFDCVLRVGALLDSSLIARPLGQVRQINCASPAYLAKFGTPQTLEDLAHHQLIHYTQTLGSKPAGFEYQQPDHSPACWPMPCSITVNNTEAYRSACLAGLGLIQVPEIGVRSCLASGQLLEVMPQHRAPPMPVTLLYANRRHLPRRTQLFMNWVCTQMKPYCSQTETDKTFP